LRLERLAPVGLGPFTRGDLLNRLVADVDAALDLPLRVVLPWVQAGIVLAACVAGLAWVAPEDALWMAGLGAVALLVTPWLASALALRAERRIAPQQAELTAVVVTTLTASADLLAFGAQGRALEHVRKVDDAGTRLQQRESTALGIGGGQAILLQGLAVAGALAIGATAVAEGRLAPPWLAVIALVPLALFDILGTLPSAALALLRLRGSADRLAELDRAPVPVQLPAHPLAWPDHPGESGLSIEVEDLSAAWRSGHPDVLHGVTFAIPAGRHLAIVGPSGSGKSTLAAILMGFLDYRGSVRIDGREVRDCDPDQLRERMGILTQRSHVFDTSIEENVRLGRPGYGPQEVWQALEQAQLAEAIRAMPRGLDTRVGTFGNALSGGEAQRLSIARLILQPPSVLLLDEPTEQLDADTASSLEVTLARLAQRRTRILITHRVSSIAPADLVVVLDGGRVVESGLAADLAAGAGWFADQWARQAQDAELAAVISTLPIGKAVRTPRSAGDDESRAI
jgi:thiol reductant ABC exporter CydC subunit